MAAEILFNFNWLSKYPKDGAGSLPALLRGVATLCRSALLAALTIFLVLLPAPPAAAKNPAGLPLQTIFPGAERIGPIEGTPPAAAAWRDDAIIGYVFLTSDVVRSVGYSGKPIQTAVGLDLNGKITGAVIIEHHEPILILGIDDSHLDAFVRSYTGVSVRTKVSVGRSRAAPDDDADTLVVDGISGASVTSIVFNDSIMRAARAVARSRGIIEGGGIKEAQLDLELFEEEDWQNLLAGGAVTRLFLRNREVDEGFVTQTGRAAPPVTPREPRGKFITLYAALLTPAGIGQNLLGFAPYSKLSAGLKPGEQALLIAAQGLYSFKGWAWRKGGVFDRLQLVQGQTTHRFTKEQHRLIERLQVKGGPKFREMGIFVVPAHKGFDPTAPWRLELIVTRDTEDGQTVQAKFPLTYQVPDRFIVRPESAGISDGSLTSALDEAALVGDGVWLQVWQNRLGEIAVLIGALLLLYVLLVFHDTAAKNPSFVRTVRVVFLAFTVVGLGWLMSAQLSVVNVITFINALLTEFRWDFFLLDPIVFILWSYVAVALLFWGRGVFCGWLCPFGALQELASRAARILRLPQIPIPFGLSERVWPIKYILFLGLLALSLHSVDLAEIGAEVEPFKTAIALKFVRAWPFAAYALGLLAAGMFVERVFCRYLCPLGAALAIPANNRMFDWLRRRRQCGTECQICATRCPVQAIHPDGRIDPHECIYCLDCQVLYYDDKVCPPAIARRKRREDRAARKAAREAARTEALQQTPEETAP